ncbi:MAG: pseudouridine synthase [Eubacterium sp.]
MIIRLESGNFDPCELMNRSILPSCNRLDRNTSGLLIAGKTIRGLQEMAEALKSRSMQKYYRCLVAGQLTQDAHLKGWSGKWCKNHQKHME